MKKIVPLIIVLLFITSFSTAHAQLKTFIKEYTYQASEDDSRNSSRTIALREVKRLLLEQLGTYLESVTEVQNFQLTKDQIVTLTAGIVRTEIIDEKWDGRIYWLSAKIVADSGEVIKSINTLRQDRTKTKELEELRIRSEAQLRDIENLKAELKIAKGDNREKVKAAYENKINSLSATEWFEKGYAFQTSDHYPDSIEAYSKAIEINPAFSRAYRNRGMVYGIIKNYFQAKKDLDKAINLSLHDPLAYMSMAIVLHEMGYIQQALSYLNMAIDIEPKFAWAYAVRGAYYNLSGNSTPTHK